MCKLLCCTGVFFAITLVLAVVMATFVLVVGLVTARRYVTYVVNRQL